MHYQDPAIQNRIEQLFNNMAVSTRITTAQTIAHDYKSDTIGNDDFKLAEVLLKFLIKDVETDVRAAVAKEVKDFTGLPREIALQLAMDIETVALPILKNSCVLLEGDLIEILKCASEAKQVEIAKRENLPATVTGHIFQFGSYPSVTACLENMSAEVSECGYGSIIVRFTDDTAIHELIIRRPKLPEQTITKLCQIVSEELKSHLLASQKFPPEITTRLIENAKEQALAQQLSRYVGMQEKRKAAVQLEADGRLTATLLLRTLILDDFPFFTTGLAQTSGISVKRTGILVASPGSLGLKILYDKARLPPYLYPAFKAAVKELQYSHVSTSNVNTEIKRRKIIDKIASSYNYEAGLSIEDLMEKLLPIPS